MEVMTCKFKKNKIHLIYRVCTKALSKPNVFIYTKCGGNEALTNKTQFDLLFRLLRKESNFGKPKPIRFLVQGIVVI